MGVILIHTTDSAGYGWNVVRTSNGNWRYEIARTASDKTPFLQFKSWVTNDTAVSIMKNGGLDLDKLRAAANSRDFQPVKTGLRVKINLNSEVKDVRFAQRCRNCSKAATNRSKMSTSCTRPTGTTSGSANPTPRATRSITELTTTLPESRRSSVLPMSSPRCRSKSGQNGRSCSCFRPPKSKDCWELSIIQTIRSSRSIKRSQTSISTASISSARSQTSCRSEPSVRR